MIHLSFSARTATLIEESFFVVQGHDMFYLACTCDLAIYTEILAKGISNFVIQKASCEHAGRQL